MALSLGCIVWHAADAGTKDRKGSSMQASLPAPCAKKDEREALLAPRLKVVVLPKRPSSLTGVAFPCTYQRHRQALTLDLACAAKILKLERAAGAPVHTPPIAGLHALSVQKV